MNVETITKDLSEKISGKKFEINNTNGDHVIVIDKENVVDVLSNLKNNHSFNFLMQVAGADYPDREKRFEISYELYSSITKKRIRVKTSVAEDETLDTAITVWRAANWFEREVYDMYGVKFNNHPNMTRILVHHQFKGHPLRKDYPADLQQHCTEAMPIHFADEPDYIPDPNKNLVPLNIGPSHPATHGTLRIMAELDGEMINRAHVELGFLHRCFEKMAETHPYNQVIPYTDRLNYCSAPMNNVGYCKTVERLMGVVIPPKAQAMRIILCELSRVIDHIVCIAACAVDIGALTGFFHMFQFREQVYTLFEKLCGARLTVSLTRIGGMAQDAPDGWYDDVLEFCNSMQKGISDLETLLSGNKIWINRTRGVGAVTTAEAVEWGYTGPCLRATGLEHDLRKSNPYYGYGQLDFSVPTGTSGDVWDRYSVRVEEMKQFLKIIRQVAKNIPEGDFTIRDKNIVLPEKKDVYGNIEGLMNHFMFIIHGLRPAPGEIYDATEAANGELGFYLVSDGSGNPYRLKVRPPCFAIYQSFPEQITGGLVADVIAILGSMNLIAGELDR